MSLDPAVEDLLERGDLVELRLIRFDLPGKTVGYHNGGRRFTWNGLVYLPNRFLDPGEMSQALGVAVTTRTIRFSNIPTDNPDDAIAQLENFDYPNAPVIVTHLAGVPGTDIVAGILASSIYEIDEVRYPLGPVNERGERTLSIEIDIEPPGRSARGATHVKRSQAEQQFHNSATDTALERVALGGSEVVEWGQRSG